MPTIPLIESHRTELAAICRARQVRTPEVFGSAASGKFDTTRSDLDFLVEFLPLQDVQHADACFGLLEDLETLFRRPSTWS